MRAKNLLCLCFVDVLFQQVFGTPTLLPFLEDFPEGDGVCIDLFPELNEGFLVGDLPVPSFFPSGWQLFPQWCAGIQDEEIPWFEVERLGHRLSIT